MERIIIVEARIMVERDPFYWSGVEIDSYSNRHLNREIKIYTVVNVNFGKINPCVYSWFASLVVL